VPCVQNHLDHGRHIPECMQNLLRPAVKLLAEQVELGTSDSRPSREFWTALDKDEFLASSTDRHEGQKERPEHTTDKP
jgi:hypothetical protein